MKCHVKIRKYVRQRQRMRIKKEIICSPIETIVDPNHISCSFGKIKRNDEEKWEREVGFKKWDSGKENNIYYKEEVFQRIRIQNEKWDKCYKNL